MLVISAGLPRSGSAWLYNLTHDLAVAAGGLDARATRERHSLGALLQGENCLVTDLRARPLLRLLRVASGAPGLVVKTHQAPSSFVRRALDWGLLRATYIHRDPRDVVRSAYAAAERGRARGQANGFEQLADVESTILATHDWLRAGVPWRRHPRVLKVSYEALAADAVSVLERVAAHLELSVSRPGIEAIVARYDRRAPKLNAEDAARAHLNLKRPPGPSLTAAQLEACSVLFATHLDEFAHAR